MTEPTISLCLVGKNELNYFLKEVLESATFVDEIIYVDTGSTDGTLEFLNKNYPKIKVFHEKFNIPQDYSNIKNIAIDHATMAYVLTTDCDEVFDKNCINIKLMLQKYPNIKMWCLFGEHYMGDFVHKDRTLEKHIWENRLFKNEPELRYPKGTMHGLPIVKLRKLMNFQAIHHYGFCKNMCDALRRFETNFNDTSQDRNKFLYWQLFVMLSGQYPGQALEYYFSNYYYECLHLHPESIQKKFHIGEIENWSRYYG